MSNTPLESRDILDEVIAGYLEAEEVGEAPAPDDLLAAHPDLADGLRRFFTNRRQLAAALPGEPPRREFVPPNVRYVGDYELLEEIARGGMGVVYRARQVNLNRDVAVKMILSGHLANEEDVRRFRTEAEAAANLRHPGIVPVHEVGEHEGFHYFSMDYIQGRNLAEIVRENPLPPRKAAEYVQAIALAVHYAHQQGTLHRDLKPSNILVDACDGVHVTDFGLAGCVDGEGDLTRTGQILGTPSYMPPEQAQGKRGLFGPASDVYSLGAILYELLTGRSPFRAESSVETLRQVIELEPVAPRALNANVSGDLETICLKCLQKEQANRYATAAALAEDLERWLQNRPIHARPVSRMERMWLWCCRRPAIAGSMAAILLTACIVAGFTVVERQRTQRHRLGLSVTSMGTSRGVVVQHTIEELERFPRGMVLTALQERFSTADETQRLPLACALAHFGDVRIDFLVSQAEDASPAEVDNIVAALGNADTEAVAALERTAQRAEEEQNWRHKARVALLALHLRFPAIAQDMCRLRPDPIQRTWFIEESSTWHGDLSKLAERMGETDDVPLRSAISLAAGSASVADVTPADKRVWDAMLSNWYRNEPDSLTHSAAGWTVRQWNLGLPEITLSSQPVEQREWYINGIGMTMLQIPEGSFVFPKPRSRSSGTMDYRNVTITRFFLADSEVTGMQFQQFIDDPDYPDAEKPEARTRSDSAISPDGRHPVHDVSWNDAVLFCNWLSLQEGLTPCYERTGDQALIDGRESDVWRLVPQANGYRLPTAAEWDYACRAGTVTAFCHGDDEALADRYMVYDTSGTELPRSRLPNAWGLFDIHGNVAEWCHGLLVYETIVTNPPPRRNSFVTRGGSFSSDDLLGLRYGSNPGFRIARTIFDPEMARQRLNGFRERFGDVDDSGAGDKLVAEFIRFLDSYRHEFDLNTLKEIPEFRATVQLRDFRERKRAMPYDADVPEQFYTELIAFLDSLPRDVYLRQLRGIREFRRNERRNTEWSGIENGVFYYRFHALNDALNEQLVADLFEFLDTTETPYTELLDRPEYRSVVEWPGFWLMLEQDLAKYTPVVRQQVWTLISSKSFTPHRLETETRERLDHRVDLYRSYGQRPTFLSSSQWSESPGPDFVTIWKRDDRKFRMELSLTRQQLDDLLDMPPDDMELVSLEEYVDGESTLYAALWVEQAAKSPWELHERLSETATAELAETMQIQGFRPTYVNAYPDGTFTTVWVRDDRDSALLLGLTYHDLKDLERERADDCLPTCIDSHFDGEQRRYSVIIDHSVEGMDWEFSLLVPESGFKQVRHGISNSGFDDEPVEIREWTPVATTESQVGVAADVGN